MDGWIGTPRTRSPAIATEGILDAVEMLEQPVVEFVTDRGTGRVVDPIAEFAGIGFEIVEFVGIEAVDGEFPPRCADAPDRPETAGDGLRDALDPRRVL